MARFSIFLVLVALIAGMIGCGQPTPSEEVVTFADPNLEAAVREAIAILDGPIYMSDLDWLISLSASERNIADLTGLEYCTSLRELRLRYNEISDISPLANLVNLTNLRLSDNEISDVSPLANLTKLTDLRLYNNNEISDISALVNLTSLTLLILSRNQIIDISPLANLTSLISLYLFSNQIGDISALVNLTSLTWLDLDNNHISDIEPLVSNPGLSEGDEVDLSSNPLSDTSINTYIPQLEARGVNVGY